MLFLFIYFFLNTSLHPINVKFDTKNIVRAVFAMIFQIQQMYVDTVNFCDRLYIHTHRYTINRNNHYSKVEILKAKHIVSEEVILTGGKKISLPERNVLESNEKETQEDFRRLNWIFLITRKIKASFLGMFRQNTYKESNISRLPQNLSFLGSVFSHRTKRELFVNFPGVKKKNYNP